MAQRPAPEQGHIPKLPLQAHPHVGVFSHAFFFFPARGAPSTWGPEPLVSIQVQKTHARGKAAA